MVTSACAGAAVGLAGGELALLHKDGSRVRPKEESVGGRDARTTRTTQIVMMMQLGGGWLVSYMPLGR